MKTRKDTQGKAFHFLILSVLWIFVIRGYNNNVAHNHGENITPAAEL